METRGASRIAWGVVCVTWLGSASVARANTCIEPLPQISPNGGAAVEPSCPITVFVPEGLTIDELRVIVDGTKIPAGELLVDSIGQVLADRVGGDFDENCDVALETIQIPFEGYTVELSDGLPENAHVEVELGNARTEFDTSSGSAACTVEPLQPEGGQCYPPLPCPYEDSTPADSSGGCAVSGTGGPTRAGAGTKWASLLGLIGMCSAGRCARRRRARSRSR